MLEDLLLGLFENGGRILGVLVGVVKDVTGGFDEASNRGLFVHQSGVSHGVGCRRHGLCELHEIVETADGGEGVAVAQEAG